MTDYRLSLGTRDAILVVTLEGEVDFTNVSAIEARILDASSNDLIAIAVDLSKTSYLDSAGVRLLFDLARHTDACRQRLGIVVPDDAPLRRLVTVTNLALVAAVSATEADCLKDLRDDVAGFANG
ncbi:MAG TPA: STAS domain-containing protein [Actinomycetota bacterium]|nr:STAS domain-containing protein [Actinomycetota bacterium]